MSEIIVGVPGPWRDRRELVEALAKHGSDYGLAGDLFVERSTGTSCGFGLDERDPYLRHSFEAAGQGEFSREALDAVLAHESAGYLVFDEPGYERARAAARFASVLLEAGGIAVAVVSAGVAHGRERWLERAASEDPAVIQGLFVTQVDDRERFYSCGMHHFGLPDAAVAATLGWDEAARLLNAFNLHQLTESPTLASGGTFSAGAGSPRFRLAREPYVEHEEPDSPTYNPHGLWSLEPLSAPRR
jgi:hypothetical protein